MRTAPLSAALVLLVSSFAVASEAYDQGVAEAKADLAKKEGFLYSYGLRTACNLDRETGLPVKAIAGCIVSTEILDRAKGYNETVAAWIAANGLPANSRKAWIDELKDLPKLWSTTDGMFTPTKAATQSPDKPYAVALGAQPQPPNIISLKVTTDQGEMPINLYSSKTEVAWGPAGSKTMIIRTTQATIIRYHLVDLQNGMQLDMQLHPDQEPAKR